LILDQYEKPYQVHGQQLALATDSVYGNTTFSKNATNTIEWNNGTSTNYTSPLDRHQAHNYTGHYDPTKHSHQQNLQRAIQSKIIRFIEEHQQNQNANTTLKLQDSNYNIILSNKGGQSSCHVDHIDSKLNNFLGCETATRIALRFIGASVIIAISEGRWHLSNRNSRKTY
jgi:hypothetical protein